MNLSKATALRLIATDSALNKEEKVLLFVLLAHANHLYNSAMTIKLLARECRIRRDNIQKIIKRLLERGYIHRYRYADTNKVSYTYHLDLTKAQDFETISNELNLRSHKLPNLAQRLRDTDRLELIKKCMEDVKKPP